MSFTQALGQVQQIVRWEQQLAGPPPAITAATTTSATLAPPASAIANATTPVSFAAALASAQAPATPPDPRVQAMAREANALLGKPYVWGGGHQSFAPARGYDCSGFVSAVLHAGGYLSAPQDTVSLPHAPGIEPGPGRYVTIYDRDEAGAAGHVIIEIDGRFYESGGAHGAWGGGGGVAAIATPSRAYLQSFDAVLHPAGL